MKKINYVYITTNTLNGKQYVGSHSTDNINDSYIGSGRVFLKAIRKYGKENFKREILKECLDIMEARCLEGFYIEKYKTMVPNGYNCAPLGGIGFNNAILSEETKLKIGTSNKGKIRSEEMRKRMSVASRKKNYVGSNHPMFGRKHSPESIKKISDSKIGLKAGKDHHMFGKNHTEETKNKISKKLLDIHPSDETKEKLRSGSLNVKKIVCEHCQKSYTPWGIKHHMKKISRNI